jgi:uncharacterized protein (DUF2267 family)
MIVLIRKKRIVMSKKFERYTDEANKFVRQTALLLGIPEDMDHAERVSTAVLHIIRERISPEESMHLVSQLPMWLKAIYVDGWDMRGGTNNYERLEGFLDNVKQQVPLAAAKDFDDEHTERNVRAVIGALKMYIAEDELNHVRSQFPPDIAAVS